MKLQHKFENLRTTKNSFLQDILLAKMKFLCYYSAISDIHNPFFNPTVI